MLDETLTKPYESEIYSFVQTWKPNLTVVMILLYARHFRNVIGDQNNPRKAELKASEDCKYGGN